MRFIRNFLLAVLIILILIIFVGLFLPTTYSVERTIVIDAGPERVHEYVGDLNKWDEWTPWKEEDPTLVITKGEKTRGEGASQSWVGKSGDGALTITKDSPDEGIEYDMVFEGGQFVCQGSMTYIELDEGETEVTWTMQGDMETPVLGGYFAIMMDTMVGEMFDRGLSNLKTTVESGT